MKALRSEWLPVLAVGPIIFGLATVAGPTIGVGAILGIGLLAIIYAVPVIGLTLMILGGTALQVLGSEHITGLPASLGKIAGMVTLVVWLGRIWIRRLPLAYSPQFPMLLVFTFAMLISALFAPDKGTALEGLFRYAQLYLLYFMIASLASESRRALDLTCLALTGAMVVSVIIAILEFTLPSLSLEYEDPSLLQGAVGAIIDRDSIEGVEIKRVTGGLSDSNWFAYTLACVLPLNLYLYHRYATLGMRLLIISAAALQSFGIVLSYTRSGFIALFAAVAYLVVRKRLSLAPLLIAAVIGSVAVVVWNPPGLQRLFSAQYLQQGSTPLREYLLKGGVALVLDSPIQGYGYSQYGPAFAKWLEHQELDEAVDLWYDALQKRVADGEDQLEWVMPHNLILQIWVEYGLLGLLSFFGFLALAFHDLNMVRRYGPAIMGEMADCLTAGTIAFIVSGMFGHLAMLKIVWILAGLAVAARCVALTSSQSSIDYRQTRVIPE